MGGTAADPVVENSHGKSVQTVANVVSNQHGCVYSSTLYVYCIIYHHSIFFVQRNYLELYEYDLRTYLINRYL